MTPNSHKSKFSCQHHDTCEEEPTYLVMWYDNDPSLGHKPFPQFMCPEHAARTFTSATKVGDRLIVVPMAAHQELIP